MKRRITAILILIYAFAMILYSIVFVSVYSSSLEVDTFSQKIGLPVNIVVRKRSSDCVTNVKFIYKNIFIMLLYLIFISFFSGYSWAKSNSFEKGKVKRKIFLIVQLICGLAILFVFMFLLGFYRFYSCSPIVVREVGHPVYMIIREESSNYMYNSEFIYRNLFILLSLLSACSFFSGYLWPKPKCFV